MVLNNNAEEILETLWTELVVDKKKSCDGTALKQDTAFKQLVEKGYVSVVSDKVMLTEKGIEEARECVRRHRLAERLLVDVFELKKELVHETGCEFEHLLHKGLNESVCTLLGHPRFCPHGKPIPEGHCCREAHAEVAKLILPLSEMEPNSKAQVAYLHTHDKETLPKLTAMGILPGTEIVLLQRFPTIVFQSGKAQFAVDDKLASHVYVRRTQHKRKTDASHRRWRFLLGKIKHGGKT